ADPDPGPARPAHRPGALGRDRGGDRPPARAVSAPPHPVLPGRPVEAGGGRPARAPGRGVLRAARPRAGEAPRGAGPAGARPRPAAAEPRRDLYCDPLPPDAIARMGTIRWRHRDDFHGTVYAAVSPTGRLVATHNFVQQGTGWVRVWELPDGRPVCQFPWVH